MSDTKNETIMNPFKTDLLASLLIGILAGLFASIVLLNLKVRIPIYYLAAGFSVLCVAGILIARFAGRYIPIIYSFGKFGETGGLNWLVDFGIFNLLILLTGFNSGIYFALFKGISFLFSALNSFFWNKFWVFEKKKVKKVAGEVLKFAIATSIGLAFNVLISYVIRIIGPGVISGLDGNLWANAAAAIGSISAMILNFVLYKIWVFK